MEYRLQSMYNHMVGRAASFVSSFYSILLELNTLSDTTVITENYEIGRRLSESSFNFKKSNDKDAQKLCSDPYHKIIDLISV